MDNDERNNNGVLWIVGIVLSILTAVAVFVLIYSAGYRGRGVIAIAFLAGAVVMAIWNKISRSWITAVFFLGLFVTASILATSILFPNDTADHELGEALAKFYSSSEDIEVLTTRIAYTGNANAAPLDGRIVGCTPEYVSIARLEVARGHFLTQREVDASASVCVITANLAKQLFRSEDPINKQLYLVDKKQYYKIVGVLQPSQVEIGGPMASQDFSRDVYVAISTFRDSLDDEKNR